jgi:hypothetical protein
MAGYGKALVVMIIAVFSLSAFYAAVAPAVSPLFSFIQGTAATGSGSPFGTGIISDISFILFILGPMLFLLAAILLPIVVGIRREVFAGR